MRSRPQILGDGMTASKPKKVPARTPAKAPQARSAAAPSPFTPIADYAFLSNCHTGALVAPDGAIDWLCVPRFDAPSIFGTLLDREAGSFRFGPYGINHPSERIYEPGTNVLVTTWKSPSGWIVVRDALTIGRRDHEDRITPHTRPPADENADHLLVRTVVCLEGRVEVELVCEPAFDYGRVPAEWTAAEGERHVADASGAQHTVRLRSDLALAIEGSRIRARHVLGRGERAYCALSWAEGLAAPQHVDEAEARIAATISYWRAWLGRARIPDHRYRAQIQRSALAIKGLTYMPTGAAVAALTTSLPETPGGERNWDQIMYGIDGRRELSESTRDDLSGYAGARPVRIGNAAFNQRQNDVFGAILDSILIHTHGVSRRKVLRQHYETDALDASTLLAGSFGFLSHDDERLRNTVLAVADELTENGFVLRYRTNETDDGLSGREGTFVICSFWLVSALAIVGEMQRARDLLEKLLRIASPLGLYAEEYDPQTGRHLGNFPQAFSHLALIEATARMIVPERNAEL
jgi:GH15 family glucan-1,4-alpha-glucosidase